MLRLFELTAMKAGAILSAARLRSIVVVRVSSPPGGSILTTSAPSSANWNVPNGPARKCVKSRIRTPL